jgi:hypothetical protein
MVPAMWATCFGRALPEQRNVDVEQVACGYECLAGLQQHKVLDSQLRTDRDKLEWQKTNVGHVSLQ